MAAYVIVAVDVTDPDAYATYSRDVPATLERLETLGVPLIGYRTGEMPGFFTAETGLPLSARAETV